MGGVDLYSGSQLCQCGRAMQRYWLKEICQPHQGKQIRGTYNLRPILCSFT